MTADLIQKFSVLVEFLGEALGPDYEIVLHDLETPENSIVAIANGHISNRKVGSPLSNSALQVLETKSYLKSDYLANFKGIADNDRILRCSTMFIKGEDGNPLGLLSIVFDDKRFANIRTELSKLLHPADFFSKIVNSDDAKVENKKQKNKQLEVASPFKSETDYFPTNVKALMMKLFQDATADDSLPPVDHLNQHERKALISKLNDQGFFQLKGAIPFIAARLSCSNATIYRYLAEIKNSFDL